MKVVKGKQKKDRVAATLMLCFCVIALTSIFTIKANINKIKESAKEVTVSEKTQTSETRSNNETEKSNAASTSTPIVDSQKNAPKKITYISPIMGGKVSKEYSMDMVVYCKTLDQFMTHPGCDITADSSTAVLASAAGTVTDVCEDDCYGKTIEITHSNGIVSRYCNLEKDIKVEKGDNVAQGETIGTIGTSSLYESADEPHLHLEFIKEGKVQNPASYIAF